MYVRMYSCMHVHTYVPSAVRIHVRCTLSGERDGEGETSETQEWLSSSSRLLYFRTAPLPSAKRSVARVKPYQA